MNREKYSEIHGALYQRAESLGYECAGFEIVSEAGMDILRLYLEMPGGIDIEDCERVSRIPRHDRGRPAGEVFSGDQLSRPGTPAFRY